MKVLLSTLLILGGVTAIGLGSLHAQQDTSFTALVNKDNFRLECKDEGQDLYSFAYDSRYPEVIGFGSHGDAMKSSGDLLVHELYGFEAYKDANMSLIQFRRTEGDGRTFMYNLWLFDQAGDEHLEIARVYDETELRLDVAYRVMLKDCTLVRY